LFLNPDESSSLSHPRLSYCELVGTTQKCRWRGVEYSFIFHANLLQLLFRSVYSGEELGISNLILKQTDSLLKISFFLDWFLMMPSITTKFQYVNSFLFSFFLTTCFGPYGPSSGEIYNWMLQWTISNTTDPLHVCDPMQRCYMLHIGAPTLFLDFVYHPEF
jgi:hypothetical protein